MVCRTANLRLGDKIILVVLLLHADVSVASQQNYSLKLFAVNVVARKNCKSVANQQNYFLVFCSEIAVRRTANLRLGDKIILVALLLHTGVSVASQRNDLLGFFAVSAVACGNCKFVASQQNYFQDFYSDFYSEAAMRRTANL